MKPLKCAQDFKKNSAHDVMCDTGVSFSLAPYVVKNRVVKRYMLKLAKRYLKQNGAQGNILGNFLIYVHSY